MRTDPFHLNRPVHLACRDVFYEHAVARIKKISPQKESAGKLRIAQEALYLLCEARNHAEAVNRSEKTSVQSRKFAAFLDVVVENMQIITGILRQETGAMAPDNPIDLFLASSDVGGKMSLRHHRCALHVLKELLQLLNQAERPFRDLRQTSVAKMSIADKDRYEKAYDHFVELADTEAAETAELKSSR